MKKILATLVLAMASTYALAAQAQWTGQVKYVTTVTYQQAISCQYNYAGTLFWVTFKLGTNCPYTYEVE